MSLSPSKKVNDELLFWMNNSQNRKHAFLHRTFNTESLVLKLEPTGHREQETAVLWRQNKIQTL